MGSKTLAVPLAAKQAAGKPLQVVIPSGARNLALSIYTAVRDSSWSANKNGGLLGMTGQTGISAACLAPPFRTRLRPSKAGEKAGFKSAAMGRPDYRGSGEIVPPSARETKLKRLPSGVQLEFYHRWPF